MSAKKSTRCADLIINFLLLLLQPDLSKIVLTSRAKRSISSLFPNDTQYLRNTFYRIGEIQFPEPEKYDCSKTVLISCAKLDVTGGHGKSVGDHGRSTGAHSKLVPPVNWSPPVKWSHSQLVPPVNWPPQSTGPSPTQPRVNCSPQVNWSPQLTGHPSQVVFPPVNWFPQSTDPPSRLVPPKSINPPKSTGPYSQLPPPPSFQLPESLYIKLI